AHVPSSRTANAYAGGVQEIPRSAVLLILTSIMTATLALWSCGRVGPRPRARGPDRACTAGREPLACARDRHARSREDRRAVRRHFPGETAAKLPPHRAASKGSAR